MKRDHDEGIRELTAEEIAAILNLPMANRGITSTEEKGRRTLHPKWLTDGSMPRAV
jgi:hypothetical protein